MSDHKAWIAGCAGQRLTADERAFFADERPFGFILFARNVGEELADLVAELKEAGGRASTPVFVDQEGGRVQRLRPPLAPRYPASAWLGELHERDEAAGTRAAWLTGRLFAIDLQAYGLNGDCLPCLDVPVPGASSVIGDRAYSHRPEIVATLGRASAEGLMAGGVLPVMKHIPGHGRGDVDSHLSLPVVSADRDTLRVADFPPFQALKDLPAAMTAHILFTAIDSLNPATLSPTVIGEVIRGEIGFDGLLMSDDMSMKALQGDMTELTRRAVQAGCDLALHCNGDMAEMRKVAAGAPALSGRALERARAAEEVARRSADAADEVALREEYEALRRLVAPVV